MKKILLMALLAISTMAFSQSSPAKKDYVYVPRIYNAAAGGDSLLTNQWIEISQIDTIEAVTLAGWSQVHLILTQATGTTGGIVIKYQGSTDGVNFGTNMITLDSLNWTAATAKKSFNLTDKCGGFYAVRLSFTGSTGPAFVGANTYSALIRKKP